MTSILNGVLLSLWRASWQGALAFLVIWAVCRVLARRLNADTQSWLWRLSYLKLLVGLLWGGVVLLPLLSPIPTRPTAMRQQVASISQTLAVQNASANTEANPSIPIVAEGKPWLNWQRGVAAVYVLGVTICVSRLLLAARRTRRALCSATPLAAGPETICVSGLAQDMGLRRVPALARSTAVDGPVFIGGRILLPADASYAEADLRMILAHELAHARRRDLHWEWLGTLVQIVFFFHPLVVLARREERLAREAAADALALEATRVVPSDYGRMLLSLALERNRPRPMLLGAVGVIEGGTLLRRRLLALRDASSRRTGRRIAFAVVSLATLLFVPWQMTRGRAQSPSVPTAVSVPDYPTMPAGDKRITGLIYDEKNVPVAGIEVGLTWYWSQKQKAGGTMTGSSSVTHVTTDTQGRFSFTKLPAGRFAYEVWSPANQYVTIRSELVLGNADTQKTIRVVVAKGSLVTGRVVDGQTGKPMAGVYVGAGVIPPGGDLAKWDYWAMPSSGITDSQGRYQVRVTPGDVFVGVGRIDDSTQRTRRIPYTAQRVSVLPGQTASAPDLSVFLRPVIVCVGPDGQPIADATFRITPDGTTPGAHITDELTDATGAVVIGRNGRMDFVKGGSFRIVQGDLAASGTFFRSPNSPMAITVDGQKLNYRDGVATVRLTSGSMSPVTGSVVSADGTPIPNALVRIIETDPRSHYGVDDRAFRTDASGAFRVPLDPKGEYHAYIRADGFNQVSVSDNPLSVVKGKATDLGTIYMVRAAGFVSGSVVDGFGKPMSGVLVYVQGGKTFLSADVTDDKGHFHIPNVVDGEPLRLMLCLHGEARDSGEALSQSNEEMIIHKVQAGTAEMKIVWHPHS